MQLSPNFPKTLLEIKSDFISQINICNMMKKTWCPFCEDKNHCKKCNDLFQFYKKNPEIKMC
jgi:hypothetical protein